MRKPKQKIVIIDWIDSMREPMGWTFKSDFDLKEVEKDWFHTSVGLVVEESKTAITITNSWRGCLDGDISIMGVLTIPKCCITKIKHLK